MSAVVHLPPYSPLVAAQTRAFQFTTRTTGTKLILTASTWTRVTLARIAGAAGAVRIGSTFTNANGGYSVDALIPVDFTLSPGDRLYYKASAAVALSVLACAIPGVEIT